MKYLIAIYGVLVMLLSAFMIVRPDRWIDLGERYCRLRYMHPLEIAICIGSSLPFILYAGDSAYPVLFKGFGYLLLAVGIGLMLTPPSAHRRFGIWSLEKTGRYFRPLGVLSLAAGGFLVYAALSAPAMP